MGTKRPSLTKIKENEIYSSKEEEDKSNIKMAENGEEPKIVIECVKSDNESPEKPNKDEKDENKTIFIDSDDPIFSRKGSRSSFFKKDLKMMRKYSSEIQCTPTKSGEVTPRLGGSFRSKRNSSVNSDNVHDFRQMEQNEYTFFDQRVIPRKKRESIVSIDSIEPPLMRPPVMGIDEMLSKSGREKQWYMAIHSSHPNEVVPIIKKPVLPIGDGGKITCKSVRTILRLRYSN